MRLTAFTDYALRALMRLAAEPHRVFTTDEIAQEFSISRNHLTKVVRELADGGFVATRRGAGGGLRLARPAEAITLGEVVRRFEARYAIVECFRADGGSCALTSRCRLKRKLARAASTFVAELDKTSLAECAYPVGADRSGREAAQCGRIPGRGAGVAGQWPAASIVLGGPFVQGPSDRDQLDAVRSSPACEPRTRARNGRGRSG